MSGKPSKPASPNLLPSNQTGKIIVRIIARNTTDAELTLDLLYLKTTWETVLASVNQKSAHALPFQDLSLVERVLLTWPAKRPCKYGFIRQRILSA